MCPKNDWQKLRSYKLDPGSFPDMRDILFTIKKHYKTVVVTHSFVSIIQFTNLQIDVAQLLKNLYVANEVIF